MENKKSERELLEKRIKVETYSSYVLIGSFIIVFAAMLLFYREAGSLNDECFLELDKMENFYTGALDSMKFYNIVPDDADWGVNGMYYYDDDYYCVNTKDRNLSEINMTDYHEMCHALIERDDENHFCKND